MRMRTHRFCSWRQAALVLLLSGFALAGCVTTDPSQPHLGHLMPIPARLPAEVRGKCLTPADPILIRIFKTDTELYVW